MSYVHDIVTGREMVKKWNLGWYLVWLMEH